MPDSAPHHGPDFRHYGDAEVARALEGADFVAALRDAFVDFAAGHAAQQPRVRTEAENVKLSTLGAVLPRRGIAGAKVYTTIGGEFRFLIALFSSRTGRPLATFDANEITRRRTAAVSVLAARQAALDDVSRIAVFGAGVQARAHAEAFAAEYPRAEVTTIGRKDNAAAAVERAQIIITATRSPTPLFDGARVGAGTFIAAVGSSRPNTRELDDALMSRTRAVIVEWKEQALREAGDLLMLDSRVRERLRLVELGEVLAGTARAREDRADIIVFKSVGVGLEDVAVAGLAYERLVAGFRGR